MGTYPSATMRPVWALPLSGTMVVAPAATTPGSCRIDASDRFKNARAASSVARRAAGRLTAPLITFSVLNPGSTASRLRRLIHRRAELVLLVIDGRSLGNCLAALDDFRNGLIREAA